MTAGEQPPAAGVADSPAQAQTSVAGWTDAPERLPWRHVIFIGQGRSSPAWYRCYLPALHMGADWIGFEGLPPEIRVPTGLVRGRTPTPSTLPDLEDYEAVVVQMPRGPTWTKIIKGLRKRGVKVIFECDDYLHGIRWMKDHEFRAWYQKKHMELYEMNMRACDAMICSTPFLAEKYRRFNPQTYVCRNGIDEARYRYTIPERDTVNLGWSGATGHTRAAWPWLLEVVAHVLKGRENTTFVSIGQPFADSFTENYPNRSVSIPFTGIEVYPGAMTMFDIALAPSGNGKFFRGKSDLRWLEASALGIPVVGSPLVYTEIEHGVTGMLAETPEEARAHVLELVDDPKLRRSLGAAAKKHVLEHREMRVAVGQWTDVFCDLGLKAQ